MSVNSSQSPKSSWGRRQPSGSGSLSSESHVGPNMQHAVHESSGPAAQPREDTAGTGAGTARSAQPGASGPGKASEEKEPYKPSFT